MNKYRQRPCAPRKPRKPHKYTWNAWKESAREQVTERLGPLHEDGNGLEYVEYDPPYYPEITIKTFQDFAKRNDVHIEDVRIVTHPGAFENERYFEAWRAPSKERLIEEKEKFLRWGEEYSYPEKLDLYNREMEGYNKKLEKYEKEMEVYKSWQKKAEIKKLKESLAMLEK